MVGCNMLVDIHLKLQTLKENILPFGGLNIIFMVSFLQFPPINYCPLCFNNIKLVFSFTKQTLEEVIGKKLWENYVCFNKIILQKQMKHVEDVQYSNLFTTINSKGMIIIFFKYVFLSTLKINSFLTLHEIQ
jgi:hypothetical protein